MEVIVSLTKILQLPHEQVSADGVYPNFEFALGSQIDRDSGPYG